MQLLGRRLSERPLTALGAYDILRDAGCSYNLGDAYTTLERLRHRGVAAYGNGPHYFVRGPCWHVAAERHGWL